MRVFVTSDLEASLCFAVQAGTLDLQLSLDLNIPDSVNYSYSNMKIK